MYQSGRAMGGGGCSGGYSGRGDEALPPLPMSVNWQCEDYFALEDQTVTDSTMGMLKQQPCPVRYTASSGLIDHRLRPVLRSHMVLRQKNTQNRPITKFCRLPIIHRLSKSIINTSSKKVSQHQNEIWVGGSLVSYNQSGFSVYKTSLRKLFLEDDLDYSDSFSK